MSTVPWHHALFLRELKLNHCNLKYIILVNIYIFLLVTTNTAFSQTEEAVHWLSFEQLNTVLKEKPKKVFIDFYADWCTACLKMQKEVFTNAAVIKTINTNYYAVKMNVETTDTIRFGDHVFINERINRRNPVHQIPLLMAQQKGKQFSLPALIFMDESFKAKARYFQYLNTHQFLKILKQL